MLIYQLLWPCHVCSECCIHECSWNSSEGPRMDADNFKASNLKVWLQITVPSFNANGSTLLEGTHTLLAFFCPHEQMTSWGWKKNRFSCLITKCIVIHMFFFSFWSMCKSCVKYTLYNSLSVQICGIVCSHYTALQHRDKNMTSRRGLFPSIDLLLSRMLMIG